MVCLLLWSLVTFTYPNDRDRVLADEEARIAADRAAGVQSATEDGKMDAEPLKEPTLTERTLQNLGLRRAAA